MSSTRLRSFLWIATLFLCVFEGFAQQKNKDLKAGLDAYRNTLYRQLKNGQGNEVELKFDYVTYRPEGNAYLGTTNEETTEHYLTLNEIEGIFLTQHNFEGILDIVRNNAFVSVERSRVELIDPREATKAGIIPRRNNSGVDSLVQHIGTLILNDTDDIKEGIEHSNHSNEVKDFLHVFVDYEALYLWDVWKILKTKDELNDEWESYQFLDSLAHIQAENFLVKYPSSEFNEFLNDFILTEYEIKKWAVGLDPIYLGAVTPLGGISAYVKPANLYTNLGLRVYYKNTFINVMGGIGTLGLRNDIYQDTTWTRGFTMLTGDLTLGHCIRITKRFNISPLIGIRGVANLGPRYQGSLTQFNAALPWTVGMEFTFGGINESPHYMCPLYFTGRRRDGLGLKVMYQNPGYQNEIPELGGGLLTVTLGINMAIFGIK